MDAWEWKRSAGHEHQPLLEFYFEQVAAVITLTVARRAHARGDTYTFQRMHALALAAADYEETQ